MSSIDNRTVKMSFDNAEFEKNAGTTLNTLDKLKQSLDFSGAAKGMDSIQASANGISFDAIASGIEALNDRFSVLGEFVHNTFMNILNTAIDVGKGVADALVITPAKEGFAEYELQMNSVQTIMASTGESVDTVNHYLDELNTYADKTIYSFSDMTANIGKFTNAGVKLDSAVSAIQGVSNVAAVAGANTNEASRAMYNFAQALSAGSVKLIDWKSIENANMATVEFKEQLMQTAVQMGTLRKEGDKYVSTTTDMQGKVSAAFDATHAFNESLSSQWMTTDVLTQTLEQYSKDVREMSQTEKDEYENKLRGLGYTEDQITAIEELGMKAADSAKDVKTFTQLIDTLKESLGSSWTKTWQIIIGDLNEAKALWTQIYTTLDKYISAMADARNTLLQGWADAGGRTAIIDSLMNSFDDLISVLEPIGKAWNEVFPPATAEQLVNYSNKLRDFTAGLKLTEEESTHLYNTMSLVFSFLQDAFEGAKNLGKTVIDIVKTIGSSIGEAFGETYISRIGMITTRFREFTEAIKPSEKTLENFGKLIKGIASVVRALLYTAIDAGSAIFDALGDVFTGLAPQGESFMDMIGKLGDWLSKLADKLEEVFDYDTFSGGLSSITDGVLKMWDAFKNFTHLDEITEKIKSFFMVPEENRDKIHIFETISKIFDKIKESASMLIDKLKESNIDITKVLGVGAGGIILKKIYEILKSILNVTEDVGKWKDHLLEIKDAIIDTFGSIQESIKADMLKKIAIAIGILVGALWVLSTIDIGSLTTSLAAIGGLMYELETMMKALVEIKIPNKAELATLTGGLIGISVAVLILAAATKKLGELDTAQLVQGLIAVTILLNEMTAVAKRFSEFQGNLAGGAFSLILLAAAVAILVIPIKKLGEMDFMQLTQGLIAVTILLNELTAVATRFSKLEKGFAGSAFGMILLAAAIAIMVVPIKQLGEMDLGQLAQGLIATGIAMEGLIAMAEHIPKDMMEKGFGMLILAASVVVMAEGVSILANLDLVQLAQGLIATGIAMEGLIAAAHAMEGCLEGAAAMLVVSAALIPLGIGLKIIGSIPLDQLAISLVAVAASIAIFGAAAAILAPFEAPMIGLAAAFALFGAAVLAIGVGIGIAAAAVSVGGMALIEFIKSLILMIPELGIKIGEMFVNFMTTIAEQAPVLLEAISTLIQTILQALMENIPKITETVLSLLTQLLQQLAEYVPQMAQAGLQLIAGFLQAIAENLPQILDSAITIVVEFVKGIASRMTDIVDAAFKLIIGFIEGLATAIDNNHMALFDAIGHLIRSIVEAIIDGIVHIAEAAKELAEGFLDGLTPQDVLNGIFEAGKNLVMGFINGILSLGGALWDAACGLANDAWNAITGTLDEHSPSRLTFGGGVNFVLGFINGIAKMKDKAVDEVTGMAIAAITAFDENVDTEYTPTITPVIDTDNFQNGINNINDLIYSMPQTYGITADITADKALKHQLVDIMGSRNDYSSIISEIDGIKENLNTLNDNISKLQVVMDSGALVGAIAPDIDNALGMRASLSNRGVI